MKELQYVCDLCQTYLTEINENDDNIMGTYIRAKLHMFDAEKQKDRHKIVELTSKMLQIEPYFKRHIYTAVSVYYYFKMWTNVVSLFEHIKDVICEPYSEE